MSRTGPDTEEYTSLQAHNAVYQALQELNDLEDKDLIAQALQEQGIKAQCSDPYSCAIAEYLTRKLPSGWGVSVTRHNVLAARWEDKDTLWLDLSTETYVDTPPHVAEFIAAFDARQYPFLIDNTYEF